MLKLESKVKSAILISCFIVLYFSHTELIAKEQTTGRTAVIGDSGGQDAEYDSCNNFYRITGIRINHHEVIDSVDLKCTAMLPSGKWGTQSHWISTYNVVPPAPLPRPNIKNKEIHCPPNQYIGSVKGASKQYFTYRALSEIAFKCYSANTKGERIQSSAVNRLLKASRGDKQYNWSNCPKSGLVFRVESNHGWSLNNFKFLCKTGHQGETIIPSPINPSGRVDSQRFFNTKKINFTFLKSTNALTYKICIKEKNSPCNIYFKTTPATSGHEKQVVPITIASKFHNKTLYWSVMACAPFAGSSSQNCSRWSREEWFQVRSTTKVKGKR